MIDQYPGLRLSDMQVRPGRSRSRCRSMSPAIPRRCPVLRRGTDRVLSSGRVGGPALLAEQYQVIKDAFAAEGVPLANAHITVNRFCHITDNKQEGLRFAENARYQSRLASSLRRREEVMEGTQLVDRPFPDEPSLEQIRDNLLIGDVQTVAEKLASEIRATHP